MVEVEHDGNRIPQLLRIFDGALCHVAQKRLVRVLASTGRYLKDDGRFAFDASLDNGLHLLHIVEVECGNGIATFDGFGKQFARIDEPEVFVTNHFCLL